MEIREQIVAGTPQREAAAMLPDLGAGPGQIIIIRHGEKVTRNGKDLPGLSEAGVKRSHYLKEFFSKDHPKFNIPHFIYAFHTGTDLPNNFIQ